MSTFLRHLLPFDDDDLNNAARDAAQAEEFRQAALGDEDKDKTLTLDELIECDRDNVIVPDDESISHDDSPPV